MIRLFFLFVPGGFQLIDHATATASSSSANTPPDSSSSSSSSSSSPSHSVKLLSYISNHHTIKCVPFDEIPVGIAASNLKDGIPADRPTTSQLYSHRIQAASKSVRILAYIYDPSHRTFIVLTSDSKIKVFSLDGSSGRGRSGASAGRLLKQYPRIAGTFKLGYPYAIKKIGDNMIYYTADEGIYVLRMD